MRKTAALFSVMAALALTVGVFAQAKPSFAGKWTMVADPAAGGGRGGGMMGLGPEVTIVQDAKTVTMTRAIQGTEVKSVYNLDGSDSKNSMNMGGNAMDMISKAKWDGEKLAITTSFDFGQGPFETKMVLSLDASGTMTVESTRPDIQGGGAPVTTKAAYKKS